MKFKFYDVMHKIFLDHETESVVLEPSFQQPGDEGGMPTRERHGGSRNAREDHYRMLREIQEQYNQQSLELQLQALAMEREKVNLLRELLQKK